MLLQPTLSAAPETEPALDQQRLFAIGLEHVRSLSRRLWTDHNIHDPGITTLELLAYALTDLSYRANFPLEDLLARATESGESSSTPFVRAHRLLPGRPVTINDYRKLLIDLPGIKNAWVEEADLRYSLRYCDDTEKYMLSIAPDTSAPDEQSIKVRGLYRVLVEYEDAITRATDKNNANKNVLAVLHENRGIGDDFVGVTAIGMHPLCLCAKMELTAEADVDQVAARIVFDVDRFLAPPIVPCRLAEMLERRNPDGTFRTVPEIFTGPLLKNGFIDDAELAASELHKEVRLSDIIGVIMKIPGVQAIRTIVIDALDADPDKAPESPDKWRLPIPEGYRPRLFSQNAHLSFYKRNVPVPPTEEKVKSLLAAMQNRQKQEMPFPDDLPLPSGRHRNVADYQSFQAHFPEIYGLSERGLPPGATPLRAAQALQLKAYLLFFDQIMANYLAMLAQVRELFSLRPDLGSRYCAQLVDSFPEWEKIYSEGITPERLSDLIGTTNDGWERRNRILDHLLARYAEEFRDYVQIMQSRFGFGARRAARAKCIFLKEYPELGAERGLAFNLLPQNKQEQWNSSNVSGFERRIARLLGIANIDRRNLSEVAHDIYATSSGIFHFRLRHPVSGKILLSSNKSYATAATARDEMEKIIRRAQMPQAYDRKIAKDGRYYFNVLAANGAIVARRIEFFTSEAAREAAIDELVEHLCSFSGEGLYVIEHILLRPEKKEDSFMPVCPHLCAISCAAADPYSYRLSIILPAYAGRFRDMDFRLFVEETLRREMPAHLFARICWVNSHDMAAIESAYQEWLAIRTGNTRTGRAKKIKALIYALFQARNVYPSAGLYPCGRVEPPFILGRTALGSADDQH
jgi:uncharacterized protein YegP (UPF0339 family)